MWNLKSCHTSLAPYSRGASLYSEVTKAVHSSTAPQFGACGCSSNHSISCHNISIQLANKNLVDLYTVIPFKNCALLNLLGLAIHKMSALPSYVAINNTAFIQMLFDGRLKAGNFRNNAVRRMTKPKGWQPSSKRKVNYCFHNLTVRMKLVKQFQKRHSPKCNLISPILVYSRPVTRNTVITFNSWLLIQVCYSTC